MEMLRQIFDSDFDYLDIHLVTFNENDEYIMPLVPALGGAHSSK